MRMFRLVCLSLCLLFASATFASAHRVNIFAYVDGGEIGVRLQQKPEGQAGDR